MSIAEIAIEKIHKTQNTTHQFSILIPSWNNLPYLQLCINSIRKNSTHSHQIIIHINESKDGTLEWVRNQPDLDYTYSVKNIGICYALNIAASISHTDYILYMNDDMYVCPNWDEVLLQEIKSIGHKNFFLSATMIEPFDSHNTTMLFGDFGKKTESFDETKLLNEYNSKPLKDWTGATWPPNIVHKDVWIAVGGYSVVFHPGMYSDPDFSMKLWLYGIRYFKGLAASRVYHFSGISTKRVKQNSGYYMFIQKWGMPTSVTMKKFLQMGKPFTGPIASPNFKSKINFKNSYKRIISAVKSSVSME
jgi:glycosyltransferase involved in cell wall biosynthesis